MLMSNEPDYVEFNRVRLDNYDFDHVNRKINENVSKKGYICCAEVGTVITASKDEELLKAFSNSLISLADGMPFVWYARLLGCSRIERITAMEILAHYLEEKNDFKHFLLGDTDVTINRIIYKAKRINNEIKVNGYSPPFKDSFDERDNEIMLERIHEEDPDLIWVSFGGVRQYKWMSQNVNRLKRGIMIGVGAGFRYYVGDLYTPPKAVQKLGMQWLFRMIQAKPKKRYFKGPLVYRMEFVSRFPFELLRERRNMHMNGRCLDGNR